MGNSTDFLLAGYAHTGSLLIGYLLMIIKNPRGLASNSNVLFRFLFQSHTVYINEILWDFFP